MTSSKPLVSVLTPSFDQARWLQDNLQSVARQSYPHIEQVVADGGSTDGSIDILRSFGHGLSWHSEPDRGQAHALNKAFARSSGEIIGWLNSDDAYYHVDAVADAVAVLLQQPHIDVVYGHAALVNARGLVLQMMWSPKFSRRLLRRYNFIVQPTVFVRRSALGATIVDERYQNVIDRELWLRLASAQAGFSRIDRVVAIDRHHPLRKTESQRGVDRSESEQLVEHHAVPSLERVTYRAELKLLKVAFRLRGAGLATRTFPPFAFDAQVDARSRLLARQVAMKRAAMPHQM